ncbi:MAG: ankyrin repeat domain-containing protein [Acidobacteriota bacterium]
MRKDWERATNTGDIAQVCALIDAGIDINALDRYGQTALMNAAHKGHIEVVRVLVEKGANLNHTAKFGLSALMLAAIADHPQVVQVLVDGGADASMNGSSRATPFFNQTALKLAEQMGHRQCAEILKNTKS